MPPTAAVLLAICLLAPGAGDYHRALDAGSLDQSTLDTEGYGEKSALKREPEGLHVTLPPGKSETGWKAPQTLHIGGDFTLSAAFVLRKPLPKPAQEDGVAVGLAVATQNIDQPDLTLVRLTEPDGSAVYRSIFQANGAPQPDPRQQQLLMMRGGFNPGGKPPKPPRPTFPAQGDSFRLELRREGSTVRLFVRDDASETDAPRYLGQAELGANDIAAVKLFVSNRNGAEPVDVLIQDFSLRADRLTGLGTTVRTVFGEVVYGEPNALEEGKLVVGGEPKTTPENESPSEPGGGTPAEPAASTTETGIQATAVAPAMRIVRAVPAGAVVAAPPGAVMVAAAPLRVVGGQIQTTQASPATDQPTTAKPADEAKPEAPKPRVTLPLDQIASIEFERTPALTGHVLGQPNIDLTGPHPDFKPEPEKAADPSPEPDAKPAEGDAPQPPAEAKDDEADTATTKVEPDEPETEATAKPEKPPADDLLAPPPGTAAAERVEKTAPKPNGVRDLHLGLFGLRDAEIQQITVNCQTDKGATAWAFDTTNTRSWPLVVRRSGREPWADLFLEPPPGDCHEKDFTIAVTYADGQSANVQAKAAVHSDPKLALDADATQPVLLVARVFLNGGDQLYGKLDRIADDSLRLTTPWQESLDVPLARIAGFQLAPPDREESPESFARRLKTRGAEDLLLARTKEGEVVAIPGVLEGTTLDKLQFNFKGDTRTLPLGLVEGVLLADRPAPEPPEGAQAVFTLPAGIVVSGAWKEIDAAHWIIQTPWDQPLKLPAAEVQGVHFRGGQVAYLSDLEPSKVEETPYFGHLLPYRRNVNLRGEPLKLDGRTFDRGLAVHSRCVLTYDLDGRFAVLRALVGFDDTVPRIGRVDCHVFADDRELFANPDLRADAPPVPLDLDVSGARQLRLVVDFGEGQGAGDRVIWADPRLYRDPPPDPKPNAPTTQDGSNDEAGP